MRYPENVKTLRTRCHQILIQMLREEREKRGVTQVVVAKRLGVKQEMISRLESGQRRVDACEMIMVCDTIGIDPVVLFRRLVRESKKRD